MQINSSEKFPIVRKLSDPSDTSTYYVQAVIRNSITGDTIGTTNLEDTGGQRFVALYVAPTDVSGQGLWIDVVTKVYSDSGYTTQDTIYADETETYLVQERFNHNLANQFGGPVGPDIDYKKIKKIVDEAIGTPKEVDLSQVNNKLDVIESKIKPIEIPKSDFSSIVNAITDIKSYLKSVPGIDKVDFTSVISKIDELKSEIEEREMEKDSRMEEREMERKGNGEKSQEDKKKYHEELKGEIKKLSDRMEEISSVVENKEFVVKLNLPSNKNSEEKPNRLSDLMNRLK